MQLIGNRGFWRRTLTVFTGTAAAQVIPLIGSLALARLYIPAEFGRFAAWLGIVLFAAVMISARLEMALALEEDGEPRRMAVVATLLTVSLGALCLATIVVAAALLQPGWLEGVTSFMLLMFAPTALFIAAAQTWQMWAAAEGRFHDLSLMRIVQAAIITVSQIAAGAIAPSATSLAAAHMVGVVGGLMFSAWRLPIGKLPETPLLVLRQFWGRHRRFLVFALPADAINTAAAQLPVLIVAGRFGGEVAGMLALTLRTLGAPTALMGRAVLDVFRRDAVESLRAHGECKSVFLRTFVVLAIFSIAAFGFLFLTAEPLFALAFGERWREAGTMAVWLMPLFALRFIASPLSNMAYLVNKQHLDLVWQVGLLGVTLWTLLVPDHYPGVIQLYCAGYSLMYVVYLVLSYRLSLGSTK